MQLSGLLLFRNLQFSNNQNVVATRKSSDHHHEVDYVALAKEFRATLNDLPVPKGDWQEDYNKRNSKYNLHLGISTGFLLFTLFFVSHNSFMILSWFMKKLGYEMDSNMFYIMVQAE